MPTYKITDPTSGKIVRVTGDSPPEPKDIEELFAHVHGDSAPAQPPQESTPVKNAMFPRTSAGADAGTSYPKQVLNAGNDLLSLAGRGVATAGNVAMGKTPANAEAIKGDLGDQNGSNIVGHVVRDPGTGAMVLLSPLAAAGGAAVEGAGLVKSLGPTLAKLFGAGAGGGIAGAGSVAAHQAGNVAEGKPVDLKQAAIEEGANIALPVAGKAAGSLVKSGMQAGGEKLMEAVLKPAKKLTQNIGSKFDVKNIFDAKLDSPMGIKAMDAKIAAYHEDLNAEYGKELASVKGGVFNAGQALKDAAAASQARLEKGGITPEEEAGIKHGLETWKNYLDNSEFIKAQSKNAGSLPVTAPAAATLKDRISQGMQDAVKTMNGGGEEAPVSYSLPSGSMTPSSAIAVRRAVQKASKFDKMDPKSVKGAELFAQDFQAAINKQLSERFPQLRTLDAKFSKLYPVEQATEDAQARTAKRYPIGLHDVAGLGAAAAGYEMGGKKGAAPGLALLALTHGMQSPGAASMLYRSGVPADVLTNTIANIARPATYQATKDQ